MEVVVPFRCEDGIDLSRVDLKAAQGRCYIRCNIADVRVTIRTLDSYSIIFKTLDKKLNFLSEESSVCI